MSLTWRYSLLDTFNLSTKRVDRLTMVQWHDVTNAGGAVDRHDGAEDQFCVRLTSMRLSQLELVGTKCGIKRGWRFSQARTFGCLCVP